jgi:hypothetical protein
MLIKNVYYICTSKIWFYESEGDKLSLKNRRKQAKNCPERTFGASIPNSSILPAPAMLTGGEVAIKLVPHGKI